MSVTFEIRYIDTEKLKTAERNGEPIPKDEWELWTRHETGAAAAEFVKELKENHPHLTFTIIRNDPLGGDRDWLMREHGRMFDGTYKPIAGRFPADMPEPFGQYWTPESYQNQFANVSFQQWLMEQNPAHVPHISQNNERKIAFTESMEKGRKDIQRALHAHEYLEKYLSNAYRLYGPMDLIVEAMGGYNFQLLIASTAAEMVETMIECNSSREVGSCMSHPTGDYESYPHHPFEAYALGGDLVLAYVRADGDKGTIWGRALAWPERKIYGRIYSTNAALFRKIMAANGYAAREESTLEGARLGVIRIGSEDSNKIVMPYIDGSQQADWDGEELTISYDGNTAAGTTNGISYLGEHGTECYNCGTHYDAEMGGVYVEDVGDYCDHCAGNYTYWCQGTERQYDRRNEVDYQVDGSTYCQTYFDDHYFYCYDCGEDFHNDEHCYDEPSNQSLCTSCHDSLLAGRDETLDTFAAIMTGNQLAPAPEPQPEPTQPAPAPVVTAIDMSGRIAASDIPEGITVPFGFAVWQPQRPHHAPPFWSNCRTLSTLVTTAQLRNNVPQGDLRYSAWNFDSTESFYIVPIHTITGRSAPTYAVAA
ncbi:hypothetical protein UFOVP344_40 [uncultured Caudovirales phage]|uniref:Uncharacterized protein n=1 Tax=uncultured Caudovirales phage TaxID=2100421 RepID=A0A6J5LW53_9CAUD|nr:hypothetical protein UFOVP344_40 [uncultured Caudovirales phage]